MDSDQHTFLQPNIYLYMPHLRQHPGSLVPNVVLGHGRKNGIKHSPHKQTHKPLLCMTALRSNHCSFVPVCMILLVSLVLGIPTVKREKQSYLMNTISSLLYSLTPAQSQDLLIIVFVAEVCRQTYTVVVGFISGKTLK